MDTAHTDHSSRAQQKGPPPPSLSYESKCMIYHLDSEGLLKYRNTVIHVLCLLNHPLHTGYSKRFSRNIDKAIVSLFTGFNKVVVVNVDCR